MAISDQQVVNLNRVYDPNTGTYVAMTQPGAAAGGLTDAELRATPLDVAVVSSTGGGLTDAELRASAVPVSLASVPSHAVTNAGTFAVQVTSAPTTAVTGTFWQATQPVSLASVPSHPVTNAGTFAVQNTEARASAASVASVASSASSVTLLASNANRRGAAFFNDSTAVCYLKFGATASTSSFTVRMAAASYYELPTPVYTGIIDGIWASANGAMRVTELT
jgi:hypothetical protein